MKKKNILISYFGAVPPIPDIEIEIIEDHLKTNNVILLKCNGALANCFYNMDHNFFKCMICRSNYDKRLKLIDKTNIHNLKVIEFPKSKKVKNSFINFNKIKNVESIINFNYKNHDIGYGIASSIISYLRDHNFSIKNNLSLLKKTTKSSIQVVNFLNEFITTNHVDKFLIFNARIHNYQAIKLVADRFKIPFASYELSSKKNSYNLWNNRPIHSPYPIKFFNKAKAKLSKNSEKKICDLFYNRRYGINVENLINFTKKQIIRQLPDNFSVSKRNISIFISSLDEYYCVKDWNFFFSRDSSETLDRILNIFSKNSNFHFFIRMHPNLAGLKNSQTEDLFSIGNKYQNVTIIPPEHPVDTYELLEKSEKIITFGSTIGLEATFWNKPSILLGDSLYKNFNCAYKAANLNELKKLIETINLKPKPKINSIYYFYTLLQSSTKLKLSEEIGYSNKFKLPIFRFKNNIFRVNYCYHLLFIISRFFNFLSNPLNLFFRIKKNITYLIKD